jgi:hypothetical protein
VDGRRFLIGGLLASVNSNLHASQMDSATAGIVAGVVSGIGAAAVAGFVTLRKVRSDLEAEYDKDLRARRLSKYLELWPKFAPLSTTKLEDLDKKDVEGFSRELREWYFTEGGIYLSRSAMDVYNLLQTEINASTGTSGALGTREAARIRFFASSLRTRMTEDLGTRRRPLLFRRSRLGDWWRRKRLNRRAEKAVPAGGYAGPRRRRT